CGGWAAFLAWAGANMTLGGEWFALHPVVRSTLVAGLLGLLLAATIGLLDALLNAVGFVRLVRVAVCVGVGLFAGLFGGLVAEGLYQLTGELKPLRVPGWILVGTGIGASIGVFDMLRAMTGGGPMRMAVRKLVNGIVGGIIGGLLGGVFFTMLDYGVDLLVGKLGVELTRFPVATGLVILGLCIGLLIGLAQVILKEAWVRVEQGFKPGRELILSKEITIGRAEGCDIGLFGDSSVEKQHCRILVKGDRYLLDDLNTPGGTYLNGQRIGGPTPLRSGDEIRVGKAVLRFGERQKRK
ncbi:MAG TPA: FHA domain-containing protein, partial [Gemmataceae bacterium]|nr:FHA domain-containing protein [Gemmataceae bacterium]